MVWEQHFLGTVQRCTKLGTWAILGLLASPFKWRKPYTLDRLLERLFVLDVWPLSLVESEIRVKEMLLAQKPEKQLPLGRANRRLRKKLVLWVLWYFAKFHGFYFVQAFQFSQRCVWGFLYFGIHSLMCPCLEDSNVSSVSVLEPLLWINSRREEYDCPNVFARYDCGHPFKFHLCRWPTQGWGQIVSRNCKTRGARWHSG